MNDFESAVGTPQDAQEHEKEVSKEQTRTGINLLKNAILEGEPKEKPDDGNNSKAYGKHWEGEFGFTTFGKRNVVDWSFEKEIKPGTVFLTSGTFDEFSHELFGLGQAGIGKVTKKGQRIAIQFGASETLVPQEEHTEEHGKEKSKSKKGLFEFHPVTTVSGLQPLGKHIDASGFATLNLNTANVSRANASLRYKPNDKVSFGAQADTVFGTGGYMRWRVKKTSSTEIQLMVTGTTTNPIGFGILYIRKK